MPLTSLPPESACKPTPPTREPLTRVSENDARCQADDHPPSASTAGASNVKGPFKRLRAASSLDGETTTPAPGPVPAVDVHRGCWWGHGLATTADSDDDEAVRGGGAGPTPFSAARGASGGLAGDALARCKLCDGEFARDDVALLNGCNHPFCVPCVETWAARRARSCPTCKKDFDGWHYGEKIPGGNDGGAVRWERRFYHLPPPTGERKPARSARALAFDPPPTFNDPEEDEDAAREMREAEARETETEEDAAVGKPETGMSGDVAEQNGTHLADTDVGDAEKDSDGTLRDDVRKRKRELPGDSAGQNDE